MTQFMSLHNLTSSYHQHCFPSVFAIIVFNFYFSLCIMVMEFSPTDSFLWTIIFFLS
jgi:hypothetical protein